jgi:lipopolysaccharide export system permease protein
MLSENARSREAELDSLRAVGREHALRAVRYALDDVKEIEVLDGSEAKTPQEQIALWQSRSIPSMGGVDAMTQEVSSETRSRAARGVALEQTVNRFDVEIHKKLAIAFACIVFTLIGPPLALRFPRGGVGLVIAASTLIFSVYWVGLIAGESLADRRVADPAVTMWVSNVVFLTAGIILSIRMSRASVNTRGESMADILRRLLAKIFRRAPEAAEEPA